MEKYLFALFVIFFISHFFKEGFSQDNLNNEDVGITLREIDLLLEEGDELFDTQNYTGAEEAYDRISLNFRKNKYSVDALLEFASRYHDLGVVYHKKRNESDYRIAIRLYEKSISLKQKAKQNIAIVKEKKSDSYSNLGKVYRALNDMNKSLVYLNKAYLLRLEMNDRYKKGKSCVDIGLYYDDIGEYSKAENKYKEVIEIFSKDNITTKEEKVKDIASNNIGAMYITMGKEKEALPYFENCLKYRENKINKEERLANTYYNLGLIFFKLKDFEKTISFYKKSLKLYEKYENAIKVNAVWNSIALLYLEKGEIENAKTAIKDFALSKKENYSTSCYDLAQVFLQEENADSAVCYSKLALFYLLKKNTNYFPPLEDLNLVDKTILLDYEYRLAESLEKQNNKKEALAIYHYCDSVIIKGIRNSHTLDQSKLFWQGKTRNIYEDAIKIALELGEIETAFNFSQKSKALTLLGKINANVALEETNLSEEIINKKRELESEIIFLEKEIGGEDFSIGKLNQARDQYEEFISSLEKDYPKYYQLKYNTKIPTVKEIKNTVLKNNKEVIIEYFLGDSAIYIFGITKEEGVSCYILENRNDILRNVEKLNQLSIDRFSKSDEFSKISNNIYQELINPITNKIKGINKLIVAPDDSLFLVPFKALVMEESDNNFKNLPYMVKEYTINECYSSTFLYTMMTNNGNPAKKLNKIKILGIAPEFNKSSSYGILKENIEGVRQGIHFFNKETSDTLFRKEATAERFTQQLDTGNYDIVYISSHAEKGEQDRNENTIVLHESELQQNEIEGLWTSHVKMIVLSACKTGDGETVKGEAPISLGWGFASTNVPSVTASLWNMDDETASILMNNYLGNLVSRKSSKSEALTEGIRVFLEGNEVGYHPYYWAGVIHYGDDRAIVSSDLSLLLVIGFILTTVFLSLGFYMKSQNFLS